VIVGATAGSGALLPLLVRRPGPRALHVIFTLAGGQPCRAVPVQGGWIVNGAWTFASGKRICQWLGGRTQLRNEEGKLLLQADGRPVERTSSDPSTILKPPSIASSRKQRRSKTIHLDRRSTPRPRRCQTRETSVRVGPLAGIVVCPSSWEMDRTMAAHKWKSFGILLAGAIAMVLIVAFIVFWGSLAVHVLNQ
jgi:hypothetical protein